MDFVASRVLPLRSTHHARARWLLKRLRGGRFRCFLSIPSSQRSTGDPNKTFDGGRRLNLRLRPRGARGPLAAAKLTRSSAAEKGGSLPFASHSVNGKQTWQAQKVFNQRSLLRCIHYCGKIGWHLFCDRVLCFIYFYCYLFKGIFFTPKHKRWYAITRFNS